MLVAHEVAAQLGDAAPGLVGRDLGWGIGVHRRFHRLRESAGRVTARFSAVGTGSRLTPARAASGAGAPGTISWLLTKSSWETIMGTHDPLREYPPGQLIPTRAARPDRAELLAETDRIRAMTVGPLEDSVSLLRQDRDSR